MRGTTHHLGARLIPAFHHNFIDASHALFVIGPLDFPLAWAKMYGKGRVFYSSLGHTEEAWDDPDIRKMYFEAIKWVLGMTEGSTTSHPRP